MKRQSWFIETLLLILAAAFVVSAAGQDVRLHPDEAHFLTFSRNAAVKGDWLFSGALDKPPLSHYAAAFALTLWGVDTDSGGVLMLDIYKGEFAARMVAVFASVVLVALVMRCAASLALDRRAGWFAGVFMVLSPLRIVFAPTVFTDMLAVTLAAAALLATCRGKNIVAGVLLALAFSAKPQAALFVPLLLMMSGSFHAALRIVAAFVAGLLPLLLWDIARPETSVFLLGAVNNTPDAPLIAPVHQWGDRLSQWLGFARYIAGEGLAFLLLMGLACGALINTHAAKKAVCLLLWLAGVTVLYTVTTFNIYDRYVLVMLPVVGILAGIGTYALCRRWKMTALLFGVTALLMMPAALSASRLQLPIGGDRGDYAAIDALAAHLNRKPVATVIYDRWLGWSLDYYLGAWHDKRRVHYPTPQQMAGGAAALDEIGTRYFIVPDDKDAAPWLAAFRAAGFVVRVDAVIDRFTVYALTP